VRSRARRRRVTRQASGLQFGFALFFGFGAYFIGVESGVLVDSAAVVLCPIAIILGAAAGLALGRAWRTRLRGFLLCSRESESDEWRSLTQLGLGLGLLTVNWSSGCSRGHAAGAILSHRLRAGRGSHT